MVYIAKGGNSGPDWGAILIIIVFGAAIAVPVILWLASIAPIIGIILILAALVIGYVGYSSDSSDALILAFVLAIVGLILIGVGIKTTDWFNTDPNAKAWRNMSNDTLGEASHIVGLGLTFNFDNLIQTRLYN